ncbi:hypothetical protein [Actinokineospora iranica]|uniref:Uncharacterized protein n=1 Tax=Actinokineospora iranica TaxID=1271860 RepID=A0A1G6JWY0_9PSEU|nr:hypothetical protein [Actinokineospora iranica]SDC22506.1 hypothetical protein SAMN05216174_101571 [Actinokineospora iranica]
MNQADDQPGGLRVRTALLAAALAAGAVLAGAATVIGFPDRAQAAAEATKPRLVCSGTVQAQFSPAVTSMPTQVRGSGVGTLDNCYSPDHSADGLRSAKVEFTGSGRASCVQQRVDSGQVRITWYAKTQQHGQVVGTTVIENIGEQSVDNDNQAARYVFAEANGQATEDSAVFPGEFARVSGNAPNTGLCPLFGISEGTGTVTAVFGASAS